MLLDPNTLSADGTVALAGMAVSDDGTMLAYALADAGSDWITWRVRDVATGQDIATTSSGGSSSRRLPGPRTASGFFYGRFPEPKPGEDLRAANYFQKLYYHKLGTPQGDDQLVYERPDQKEWKFATTSPTTASYLVITVSKGTDDATACSTSELDAAGREDRRADRQLRRRLLVHRQRRPRVLFQDQQGRPARPGDRHRRATSPSRAHWKEIIPAGRRDAAGRAAGRRPASSPTT